MTSRKNRRAFTLIELLIVIGVIAVLSSIAFPNMIASRQRANESSAIASLRLVASAEETYRARRTPPAFGTLAEVQGAHLLDSSVAGGHKSGYTFSVPTVPDANSYTVIATPDLNAGNRYFFMDQTGVIRSNNGAPATVASTPVE